MNANKRKYASLCRSRHDLPLFSQDWWLDAVCGPENWQVALVEKGGDLVAAMPYRFRTRHGLLTICMPPLTQTLGPWICYGDRSPSRRLSYEREVMDALLDQLPTFRSFSQNWHHGYTNWLPFYWRGFQQTTRYTYVIDDLSDMNAVWHGLGSNIRREIRKAQSRYGVLVYRDCRLSDVHAMSERSFLRQGIAVPYDMSLLQRIDDACAKRGRRMMFMARDANGVDCAAVYLVWDSQSAYYLLGGADPVHRSTGAMSLCMWEAILHASTVTAAFDFEGSIIEPIEKYFRGFGALQKPYFNVYKRRSRMALIGDALFRSKR